MGKWFQERLRERSTYMGLIAVALAVALLVVPVVAPAEAAALLSSNIQWLIGALFIGGLGSVIWREKP